MQKTIKTVGWIGTGVMGIPMCQHLMNKNYNLNIYTRTQKKADPLIQMGAKFKSVEEVASQSDIVFMMLGYPKDVQQIVEQVTPQLKEGQVLVDHTTSSPDLAKLLTKQVYDQSGAHLLDAPVTGGDVGAKRGDLTIMTGGDKNAFDIAEPVMNSYGKYVHYVGDAGRGQHTKMGNQIVIASNLIGTIEGILYAHKAGLDTKQFVDIIKNGSASSTQLINFGPKMIDGDYEPGFYVEHFVKDMDIALQECRKMNLSLPSLGLVRQFYEALLAQGGSRNGTHGLVKVLEQMNNMKLQ